MAKAKKKKGSKKVTKAYRHPSLRTKVKKNCHGGLLNAGNARPEGAVCNGSDKSGCGTVSRKMKAYFRNHKPVAACHS